MDNLPSPRMDEASPELRFIPRHRVPRPLATDFEIPVPSRPPSSSERSPARAPDRRWMLALGGLFVFHLALTLAPPETGLWMPALGVGVVLLAWLGLPILLPLAVDAVVVRFLQTGSFPFAAAGGTVLTLQITLSWWAYHVLGKGTRRLDDPHSATLFLIVIPGVVAAAFAGLQAGLEDSFLDYATTWLNRASAHWVSCALGLLVLTPPLLVLATPILVRFGLAQEEKKPPLPGGQDPLDWTLGEAVETGGLVIGAAILGVVLALIEVRQGSTSWHLWAVSLLLVIWAGLRQGIRGGPLAASAGGLCALITSQLFAAQGTGLSSLQGNLLAQCSAVLLVGASAGWIRASEARYRQVVGHIPVVLYSARLPRPVALRRNPNAKEPGNFRGESVASLVEQTTITLVSQASVQVFNCPPDHLLGPYRTYLEQIFPEDRELISAALAQLGLQRQPVTCEYRLNTPLEEKSEVRKNTPALPELPTGPHYRWVRDTMAPYHSPEGALLGWEGVVEDITEQRALANDLRRTTSMLHALITHLPMGVFFVQGPQGQPILVNSRARQLLGQREDLSAGVAYWPQVYRLHRGDGSIYPSSELPVTRALDQGVTSMCNDIVVHRSDGRRIPLVTWAGPVALDGTGQSTGAVWVLEDLTALKQAESAWRESENRLRAVIESMAEGVIIFNQAGIIAECNPAATAILGFPSDKLLGQQGLAPGITCLRDDGSLFTSEEHPERLTLQTGKPMHGILMGLASPSSRHAQENGVSNKTFSAATGKIRWILVNTVPLPSAFGIHRGARVVATFADVTAQRQALEVVQAARIKFQELVESLPLVVLQLDSNHDVAYANRATLEVLGYGMDQLSQPGFWMNLIHAEDVGRVRSALVQNQEGFPGRVEFRYQAGDRTEKVALALTQPNAASVGFPGSTCVIIDLTLQRRLEEELRHAQRLELVGRLASGTVHDFNNVLTAMIGLACLAQEGLPSNHPTREDLERIVDLGEQATHLAGQLLTFSKQPKTPLAVVDLNFLVLHTLKLLRGTIPANIQLIPNLAPDSCRIKADDTQLKQVLMNLCLNARDALPEGGQITVRTETRSGEVGLVVEDNGLGMNDDVQARVFEPFFSTKENGTGLGLAVVRQIVDGLGATIQVWSEPGKGARFEIWFPAAAGER